MEPKSKKNQVKHDKYGSIMLPHISLSEVIIIRPCPWPSPRPEIYP